ncbi:unnamed protein product [Wuchereria bancrofti]|uniref:Uncharacterized protein n=1 Tax=Wuchereria bancrofti TaxID=6293 RepID=A0A3P7DTL4_WUCBA|nr:unnamed protein product [Wuchereria bancrofti]
MFDCLNDRVAKEEEQKKTVLAVGNAILDAVRSVLHKTVNGSDRSKVTASKEEEEKSRNCKEQIGLNKRAKHICKLDEGKCEV